MRTLIPAMALAATALWMNAAPAEAQSRSSTSLTCSQAKSLMRGRGVVLRTTRGRGRFTRSETACVGAGRLFRCKVKTRDSNACVLQVCGSRSFQTDSAAYRHPACLR